MRARRSGSWVITYGFDQFLVVDDEIPTKGWGIFGNISLADQATNPVHWFLLERHPRSREGVAQH